MNSPDDPKAHPTQPGKDREIGELLFDLENLSDDDISEEDVEEADNDATFLAETKQNEQRLATSILWIGVVNPQAGPESKPLQARDVSRMIDSSVVPISAEADISNLMTLLTDQGQTITCRIQKSADSPNRRELDASWPDRRRPFELCLFDIPSSSRPVSRTILQQTTKPLGPSHPTPQEKDRFLLSLQESKSNPQEQDSANYGFQLILCEPTQEVLISARRLPDDSNCLPVLLQTGFDSPRHQVIVLHWMLAQQRFVGAFPVEPDEFRNGSLRCEVRELRWPDFPKLSPHQVSLALSGRRLMAIQVNEHGPSVSFDWEEWHTAFVEEVPDAIVGLRVPLAGSTHRG